MSVIAAINVPSQSAQILLTVSPWLRRGLAAGTVWGVALATGLIGLNVFECGAFCAPDAMATAAVSIPAGVLTIGPLAALAK